MRRFVGSVIVLAISALTAAAEPFTDGDRQRLLAHLDMTENWLVSEVTGLSDEQVRFHRAPDAWSIMDVVEHLAIAEPQYWRQLQESVKQPAAGDKSEATDAGILWYGIDRTNRQKTGEARVPTGKWKDISGSLGEFRKLLLDPFLFRFPMFPHFVVHLQSRGLIDRHDHRFALESAAEKMMHNILGDFVQTIVACDDVILTPELSLQFLLRVFV